MSKFFTWPVAPLLASTVLALASEKMPTPAPVAPLEPAPAAPPAASSVPSSLSLARFSVLAKKSPFTLASTTEENADFAKDLVLAGYFRMDGQDFVMVANRTRPERLMVGTQSSPAAQGLVLVKVERDPSGDPTKLRAQIRKGTETALLKYEAAPAPSAAPPGQPVPGQPAQAQVPAQVPGQAVGTPGQAGQKSPTILRRRIPPIPTVLPSR